jgi:hypothetical protein
MTPSNGLARAAERASEQRGFLGWDLARIRLFMAFDRHELARQLALDDAGLTRLELCRSPRRDRGFRSDVEVIADYVSSDARRLAGMVRLADALAVLRTAPASHADAVLAAARDVAGEHALVDQLPPTGTLYQPTWLHQAVEAFWADDPSDRFPRDLELEAISRLPLALVELPRLRTDGVADWLTEQDSPLALHVAPRPLRAALIAYAGVGVIFIDALLDPGERLIGIAHEIGHFLNDYLVPRATVERTAPELLEVLDGLRPPSRDDAVTALLARVPLGVHTHLLSRTTRGEYGSPETERSEDQAARIAWELLAPQEAVTEATGDLGNEFTVTRTLQSRFGLPGEAARAYARYLAEASNGDDDFGRRFHFDS